MFTNLSPTTRLYMRAALVGVLVGLIIPTDWHVLLRFAAAVAAIWLLELILTELRPKTSSS